MTTATDHAPAPDGGMSPYGCWEIDVRMWDAEVKQIDAFTCRQDLWADADQFVVRLTRLSNNGNGAKYEDRGAVTDGVVIRGRSGFGGTLLGHMMKNNTVFLQGTGGVADYVLTATQTAPDHYRCFRQFQVKEPIALWGTQVMPGTYYITTEDQLQHEADEPPAELRTPL